MGKSRILSTLALAGLALASAACATGPAVSMLPSMPLAGKSFLVAEVAFAPRLLPTMPFLDAAAYASGAEGIRKQVEGAQAATAATLADSVSERVAARFKGSVAKAPNPFAKDGALDLPRAEVPDAAATRAITDALAASGAEVFLVVAPRIVTEDPGFLGVGGKSRLSLSVFLYDAAGKLAGRGDILSELQVTNAGDVGQIQALLGRTAALAAGLIALF